MRYIFTIFALLFSSMATARDVKINELSTEYRNTNCGEYCAFRHPFLDPEQKLNYSIIQNMSVSFYDYILFENSFFFDGYAKVLYAGLEYKLGFELPLGRSSTVSFGKWHHSSHAIDKTVRDAQFPLTDALFLKINWISSRR